MIKINSCSWCIFYFIYFLEFLYFLKDDKVDKFNFIATNGAHPLVSMKLVEDIYTIYFRKDWHFTTQETSKWVISKTLDRHFQCARNLPNSLQLNELWTSL